jgi:hypothetical protein
MWSKRYLKPKDFRIQNPKVKLSASLENTRKEGGYAAALG